MALDVHNVRLTVSHLEPGRTYERGIGVEPGPDFVRLEIGGPPSEGASVVVQMTPGQAKELIAGISSAVELTENPKAHTPPPLYGLADEERA